jgi:hypothetical protein
MSSQNFDSPTYTFILNVDDGIADNVAITGIADKSGQFAFLDTGLSETGAAASGSDYYFAFRNTKSVFTRSSSFDGGTIANAVSKDTAALTEQITYVGYNGTSGSMDAVNATYYSLGLVLNHTFGLLNNSPLMKTIPFKSTAATQSNVAAGLVNAGVLSFARGMNKDVKFERVNSGAQLVALNNAQLINGASTFSTADDDTASILVGSIIRIEEPENDGAASTDPCYVVTAHDSGVGAARIYTLDAPFQGVTNADHDHFETVTEGDWGIKMTGVSIADAKFNPITDTPYVVNFEVELHENFATAEVTYSTGSDIGFGTYQLVSYDEAFGLFNDKDKHINAYPPQPNHTFEAVSGNTYNCIEFEASDSKYSSATTGLNPISKFRVKIWYLDSTCDTDYGTAKTTVAATAIT